MASLLLANNCILLRSHPAKLEDFKTKLGIDQTQATEFHIIVQNCCLETWALGNADILIQYSAKGNSDFFSVFQPYYDVLTNDPELMNCPPEYITKSRFHEKYLKQYLREFGLFYKKERPKTIEDKTYLDALIIKMQINQSFIESEVFIRYLGRDVEKAIAVWFGGIGDLGNTSHKPN